MTVKEIDSDKFNKMIQAASNQLKNNVKFINSLNVFPVPDGDTGTNISLSMANGAKYVENDDTQSVGELSQSLAKGLLMGARGNSGVILSQIFRGFAQSVKNKSELNADDLVSALKNSAESAYKAVMKPTEGTILTVIRKAAEGGSNELKETSDVAKIMDAVYNSAEKALKKTPDLLPILKQVGVVDSGGQGLVFVLQAFADVLNNRPTDNHHHLDPSEMNEMVDVTHHKSVQGEIDPSDIKYGYCTQMTVRFGHGKEVDRKFEYQPFYDYLAKLGDSLLVINDDEVAKVHVHTEHPGKVLAWGQHFGDLIKIKIDNMRRQQEDIIKNDKQSSKGKPRNNEKPKSQLINGMAIIAVVTGNGLMKLFNSLGVTNFINGGQSMNPSTHDILAVINESHAKKAIILPNNGNIFMAASQAANVASIPVQVVHSKTISQGLTSMLGFNPDNSLKENHDDMEDNLGSVISGEVTNAIRDTKINGLDIKKNQYMGIINGNISVNDKDKITATVKMVKKMLNDDSEVVTIIYGKNSNQDEAQKIADHIKKIDDELEIEIHEGDQPIYPFLISVE
ncbi:hypothetical protein WR164_07970 [Philodulcilactobacillus myokoensis]|uniref:DhaL domain-containing protein n=1 Tax=Philodulcilactobacillus myokoensis TaxID=2929573 RepID=A0A9W6B1A1_9LACO|nr:DAK2 domain-containing protein [Philodulcilactobacillus myokoensis]GLB46818.1 hypothetical protein WR164_07970 [Philodulcilactobacillus myokoensis]